MSNILGNIGNFADKLSNSLRDVQYKNLAVDNPALYGQLEQSRQLGNIRRLELEQRQAERSAEIERQKMLGTVLRTPAGQEYMKRIGLPAEIAPAIGSISDMQALGKLTAPEDMGATGALVKRVMQDNPGMSFSDALAQVQTGFRSGLTYQGGVAAPMQGYGAALGSIAGQKQYGQEAGGLQAKQQFEPALAESIAAAQVAGAGKITPQEQRKIDNQRAAQTGKFALLTEKDNLQNINTVTDRLLKDANIWTTGFLGKSGSFMPGSPQLDFAQDLETVLSDSALSRLVELKNSSDTGASGLGSITEREISLLQASKAAVAQAQSPEQFRKNLQRYKEIRNKTVERVSDAYKERFGELPAELVPTGQSINNNVFNSVQEAESANLPKGTEITVNGRRAVVE